MTKYVKLIEQRKLFKNFENILKISEPQDWYKFSLLQGKQLIKNTKSTSYFGFDSNKHDLIDLLHIFYPKFSWKLWLFRTGCSDSFWKNKKNTRFFLSYLADEIQIQKSTDWFEINTTSLSKKNYYGGFTLFQQDNFSFQTNLVELYPEYLDLLKAWKFIQVPVGYWKSLQHQQLYFSFLAKELGISNLDDWYNVSSKSIGVLYLSYNSMVKILQNIYPSKIWLPWRFTSVSKSCWIGDNGKFNRRQSFDESWQNSKIKSHSQWYDISWPNFSQNIASISILKRRYKASMFLALSDLYPEISLIPWKFTRLPSKFWETKQHIFDFLFWCENYFQMKSKSEWQFIKQKDIIQIGGSVLIKKYDNISNILNTFYPDITINKKDWNQKEKLLFHGGKTQYRIFKLISDLFPEEKIFQNYKHPNLFFEGTNQKIEYDIFLPSLNLGFEYQGEHHYEKNLFGNPVDQQQRDNQKKKLSKDNSITLIEIPYWWKEEKLDIKTLIQDVRPDILI